MVQPYCSHGGQSISGLPLQKTSAGNAAERAEMK
jgi:hypothetical protein